MRKRRILSVTAAILLSLSCVFSFKKAPQTDSGWSGGASMGELQRVAPFGVVPDNFQPIIENNAFDGAVAFGNRLLKTEVASSVDGCVTHLVRMMDPYGNALAEYSCESSDAYRVTTLTATADGGFLFVLGFSDHVYGSGCWASDNGFASRVIKCDADGRLQFDAALDGIEGAALEYCFEKDGRFYLFGAYQAPETKVKGVHSPTDIYMVILDGNGSALVSKTIAGSDYDDLRGAETADNGFVLSVSSQSDDGAFEGSGSNGYPIDWLITVNGELTVTEMKKESGRGSFDRRLGEKDGLTVYRSNSMLDDFDGGTPLSFIAYSDFYLIVSENPIAIDESTPPTVSSIRYVMETIYSAYGYNGELLFRTAVER